MTKLYQSQQIRDVRCEEILISDEARGGGVTVSTSTTSNEVRCHKDQATDVTNLLGLVLVLSVITLMAISNVSYGSAEKSCWVLQAAQSEQSVHFRLPEKICLDAAKVFDKKFMFVSSESYKGSFKLDNYTEAGDKAQATATLFYVTREPGECTEGAPESLQLKISATVNNDTGFLTDLPELEGLVVMGTNPCGTNSLSLKILKYKPVIH